MNKTTAQALKEKQSWPLWKKVEHSKKRIVEFVEHFEGEVFTSYSGV